MLANSRQTLAHLSTLNYIAMILCAFFPQSDLLIALGVRFDDRVTGKLEAFATRARIVHIDIDPAEIDKNKSAHIPICADVKPALHMLNKMLEQDPIPAEQYAQWRADLDEQRTKFPMRYPDRQDVIAPQHAVQV